MLTKLTYTPQQSVHFYASYTLFQLGHVCLIVPWLHIKDDVRLGNNYWLCKHARSISSLQRRTI